MQVGDGRLALGCLFLLLAIVQGGCSRDKSSDKANWEVQSHYQKGNQALGKGDLEAAEGEYRATIALDPGHTGASVNLARVLIARAEKNAANTEMLAEAIKLLKKAVANKPQGKIAYGQLARALILSGRIDEALDTYRRLVEIDVHDVKSYLAMAAICVKQNKLEQAEKIYRQGLESIKQDQAGALALAYGRFLIGQKNDQQARKILESINEKQPEHYEALDELGAIAVRQGRFEDVRRIYQTMVKINPRDYMVFELLAAIDEREGKLSEAEKNYRSSLNINRQHMSAWTGLGRCLRKQGKKDQAVYALRKSDGFLGRDPKGAIELADEVLALGDKTWARSVLERAKLATDDASLQARLKQKLDGLGPTENHGGDRR
jgi:tetratricopeptide (TPR) repeat protein